MTDYNYRDLCAELVEAWDTTSDFDYNDFGNLAKPLVARARAALAEPANAPAALAEQPSDDEIHELALNGDFLVDTGDGFSCMVQDEVEFARAVLARWGHDAPVPVPVNERLPGPEDCDDKGRCWWWRTDNGDEWWELLHINMDVREYNALCGDARYTHWLPAHALPQPAPQGGEVEP